MKTKNRFIEFTNNIKHDIQFEESAKKIILENIEVDSKIQLQNEAVINLEFVYTNEEKLLYPIFFSNKNNNETENTSYFPNYSFDISKVKRLNVFSKDIMPVKMHYYFE